MNEPQSKTLHDIYENFEAGKQEEALRELRGLHVTVSDRWDNAELLYHETLFLLEMKRVSEARQTVDRLSRAVALLADPPSDSLEIDVRVSLPVMVRYAELEVLIGEGHEERALQLLEALVSRYPMQLSTLAFQTISQEIEAQHGFLLADIGRWREARPFLEKASPPEEWKAVLCYYLGHCYYTFREHESARTKLLEAFDLGLASHWLCKAHYILGLVEYHLHNVSAAKRQFESCVTACDPVYLGKAKIFEWLEATSRDLGLHAEAEDYRRRTIIPPGSRTN